MRHLSSLVDYLDALSKKPEVSNHYKFPHSNTTLGDLIVQAREFRDAYDLAFNGESKGAEKGIKSIVARRTTEQKHTPVKGEIFSRINSFALNAEAMLSEAFIRASHDTDCEEMKWSEESKKLLLDCKELAERAEIASLGLQSTFEALLYQQNQMQNHR